MITEKTMLVEPKFQDATPVDNHMRVIMASNNSWVVPAGLDERRFFVLDVSDRNQKDIPYFAAISKQMCNGGHAALMHLLINREIQSNLRTIPRTQALFDQMVHTMNPIDSWWLGCLLKENIPGVGTGWPIELPKDAVYNSYFEYCEKFKKRYIAEDSQFFKALYQICPGALATRPRAKDGKPRLHCVVFPELGVCRRSFEGRAKMLIDWDVEGDGF
jgi:hypothetical protein